MSFRKALGQRDGVLALRQSLARGPRPTRLAMSTVRTRVLLYTLSLPSKYSGEGGKPRGAEPSEDTRRRAATARAQVLAGGYDVVGLTRAPGVRLADPDDREPGASVTHDDGGWRALRLWTPHGLLRAQTIEIWSAERGPAAIVHGRLALAEGVTLDCYLVDAHARARGSEHERYVVEWQLRLLRIVIAATRDPEQPALLLANVDLGADPAQAAVLIQRLAFVERGPRGFDLWPLLHRGPGLTVDPAHDPGALQVPPIDPRPRRGDLMMLFPGRSRMLAVRHLALVNWRVGEHALSNHLGLEAEFATHLTVSPGPDTATAIAWLLIAVTEVTPIMVDRSLDPELEFDDKSLSLAVSAAPDQPTLTGSLRLRQHLGDLSPGQPVSGPLATSWIVAQGDPGAELHLHARLRERGEFDLFHPDELAAREAMIGAVPRATLVRGGRVHTYLARRTPHGTHELAVTLSVTCLRTGHRPLRVITGAVGQGAMSAGRVHPASQTSWAFPKVVITHDGAEFGTDPGGVAVSPGLVSAVIMVSDDREDVRRVAGRFHPPTVLVAGVPAAELVSLMGSFVQVDGATRTITVLTAAPT